MQLTGRDTICDLQETVQFKALKNPLCILPVKWSVDNSAATIVATDDSTISLLFKKAGIVKLYGQFAANCKPVKDSLQINVFASPRSINLGPDIQLCNFSILKLSAGSGFKNYLWNDGSTDSVLTIFNVGRYLIKTEDYCGNAYFDTINISQSPVISFDLGPDLKKCDNDTLIIKAPGNFSKYTWSADYNIDTIDGNTVKVWPAADTIYSVIAEVASGCTVVDTIRISVERSEPIYIGNDTSFCTGGAAVFKAPGGFKSYTWQDGSAGETFTAGYAGTYWVHAINANGCISKDTAEVKNVYAKPALSLGSDLQICLNETQIFNAGAGFKSYLWQDNSTKPVFTANQTGTYWVQVTDNYDCSNADTVRVTGYKEVPQNFVDSAVAICTGRPNELKATGTWASYLWSTNATGSSIVINAPGDYWLQVTNSAGCSARDTIKASGKDCWMGVYFPNALHPITMVKTIPINQ